MLEVEGVTARRSRSLAKQPAPPPPRPSKGFAPGDAVVVLDGISKGVTGRVVALWGEFVPGVPSWRVDLPDCADRVIREDFLERVG